MKHILKKNQICGKIEIIDKTKEEAFEVAKNLQSLVRITESKADCCGDFYESRIAQYPRRTLKSLDNYNYHPTIVPKMNSTLTSDITFVSIYGGLEAFVALGSDGNYYKIHQPRDKKIQVELINDTIKTYSEYKEADDTNLLSVDFSSKLSGSTLRVNEGIVWVNEKNELKGDYFTADNVNDNMFINAIKKIKWKKIKVISDDNGICGIDTNNQMYCWGIQSFYRNVATTNDDIGNTFMIPVFNTNLFDLDKDYLVAEGGRTGYLTNMTEEEWKRDSDGAFFIKYPTYIGGFNYEFTFK